MEYNELHKKYEPMIDRITNKYASVASKYALEVEDLRQICAVALWKASKIDSKSLTIPLEAYIYKSMEFALRKEIDKLRRKDMNCISLQLLASQDDDTTTLQDTLVDDNVDIEASAIDREMYKFYEAEIRRVLPKDKADALINKCFRGYLGVNRYKLWSGKNELIKRSFLFREEYFKLKGIKVDLSLYD